MDRHEHDEHLDCADLLEVAAAREPLELRLDELRRGVAGLLEHLHVVLIESGMPTLAEQPAQTCSRLSISGPSPEDVWALRYSTP